MELNKRILVVILLLVFFQSSVTGEAARKGDTLQGISEKQLKSERKSPDESLFLEALNNFRQGSYSRARSMFKELVSNYPKSSRVKDSLYYLDRIKLHKPSLSTVPKVRVQLSQKEELKGRATGDAIVMNGYGKKLGEIKTGEQWKAYYRGGSLIFSIADRSRHNVGSVLIRPPEDGFLKHGNTPYRGVFEIRATDSQLRLINDLSIKKYLYGVVRKEIAPGWPMPTVKAQSVAARSFALYHMNKTDKSYDLGSTGLAQVYGGVDAETPRIKEAVNQTQGSVLTYNGQVVPAFFHANSGGYIERAGKIWEGSRTPFIEPKKDPWSVGAQHDQWSNTISYNTINKSLHRSDLPRINPGSVPTVSKKLPSGRALQIKYETMNSRYRTVPAEEFRMAIGSNIIRSAWFTEIDLNSGQLRFKGKGWGHGIGMSQWGAKKMAEAGKKYRQILSFYYENATLADHYGPSTVSAKTVSSP